jgi:hypothetical protein
VQLLQIQLLAWTHHPPLRCDDLGGDNAEVKILSISLDATPLPICTCIVNGDAMTAVEWSLPDPIPGEHGSLVIAFLDLVESRAAAQRLVPGPIGFGRN